MNSDFLRSELELSLLAQGGKYHGEVVFMLETDTDPLGEAPRPEQLLCHLCSRKERPFQRKLTSCRDRVMAFDYNICVVHVVRG